MKKFIILFFLLLFPIVTFSAPAESIATDINNLTCPYGSSYGICGGINSTLHNQFVEAIKKKDAVLAIQLWDSMKKSTTGVDDRYIKSLDEFLWDSLFGNFSPEGAQMLPGIILAKKPYKGGILMIGSAYVQDRGLDGYYISYMRYK